MYLVNELIYSIFKSFMEERTFFHSMCSQVLRLDLSIAFAAIVDKGGKLIVGKSKRNAYKSDNYGNKSFHKFHSTSLLYYDLFNNDSLSFIKTMNISSIRSNLLGSSASFQLCDIGEGASLAFIPINEQRDKYLCAYIKSSSFLPTILHKLNSVFA